MVHEPTRCRRARSASTPGMVDTVRCHRQLGSYSLSIVHAFSFQRSAIEDPPGLPRVGGPARPGQGHQGPLRHQREPRGADLRQRHGPHRADAARPRLSAASSTRRAGDGVRRGERPAGARPTRASTHAATSAVQPGGRKSTWTVSPCGRRGQVHGHQVAVHRVGQAAHVGGVAGPVEQAEHHRAPVGGTVSTRNDVPLSRGARPSDTEVPGEVHDHATRAGHRRTPGPEHRVRRARRRPASPPAGGPAGRREVLADQQQRAHAEQVDARLCRWSARC